MKNKVPFLLLSSLALTFFSCSKEIPVDGTTEPEVIETQPSNIVNASGQTAGVTYSLNDLVLNPEVIVLNDANSRLRSSAEELAAGIVRIDTILDLFEGNVLYIRSGDYTGLRKITAVVQDLSGEYLLETSPAHLGELFEGGEINLSLDLLEWTRAAYGIDKSYEIIDVQQEYQLGGLTYNPSTNVRLALDMQMEFKKWQLLPARLSTVFEITPTLNPYILSTGAINQKLNPDIAELLPPELIEFLERQSFEIDIPINALGIESLPATVRIDDIKMPTSIEANLSGKTDFSFGVGGSWKAGYTIDIAGLKATVKPIYENSIVTVAPDPTGELPGELMTNREIIITPSISVLGDLYKMSGDIVFGFKTESAGSASLRSGESGFASKGVFTSRMTVLVDLILTKLPVDIFNKDTELWNVGSLEKKVVYSDLSWKVTSKYSTNLLLLLSRVYQTDFTLNYAYPIQGKKIPDELLISYEVYQDNGTTRIQSVKDQVVVPTGVTNDSFGFSLGIPYKSKLFSYQTTSYLKNIVIRDRNGYVYEGVYNSAKGDNENSFAIQR
jgi:hypothetical protein